MDSVPELFCISSIPMAYAAVISTYLVFAPFVDFACEYAKSLPIMMGAKLVKRHEIFCCSVRRLLESRILFLVDAIHDGMCNQG